MIVSPTPIEGILLIEPVCHEDSRGFFIETYQAERYWNAGIKEKFVQDNQSRSMRGVLRGMHYQIRRPQAQIVTVMSGEIFDAVVDLRTWSSTFGKWFGTRLSDSGPRQIYMTAGFAHGFCVLSERAEVHYKVSQRYDRTDEAGLLWDDADIGIMWPIIRPDVAQRDALNPKLKDLKQVQLPQQWGSADHKHY